MADITITAANVRAGSDTITELKQAGATITAGDILFLNVVTGKWSPAFAYLSDAQTACIAVLLFALSNASADEYVVVAKAGDVTVGGTIVDGEIYVLGAGAGGFAPADDLTTGWYSTRIGYGKSTSVMTLDFSYTGRLLA